MWHSVEGAEVGSTAGLDSIRSRPIPGTEEVVDEVEEELPQLDSIRSRPIPVVVAENYLGRRGPELGSTMTLSELVEESIESESLEQEQEPEPEDEPQPEDLLTP